MRSTTNTQNVVERVNALTLHGADIVFDHVAGKAFTDGLKMIAPLGMIVSYAVLGGVPEDDLFKAMRANIEVSPAVRCFTMHTYDHMPEPRREAMQAAVELLAGGGQAGDRGRVSARRRGTRARPRRAAPRDREDRAEAVILVAQSFRDRALPRAGDSAAAGTSRTTLLANGRLASRIGRIEAALVGHRLERWVRPTTVSAAPSTRKPSRSITARCG